MASLKAQIQGIAELMSLLLLNHENHEVTKHQRINAPTLKGANMMAKLGWALTKLLHMQRIQRL